LRQSGGGGAQDPLPGETALSPRATQMKPFAHFETLPTQAV